MPDVTCTNPACSEYQVTKINPEDFSEVFCGECGELTEPAGVEATGDQGGEP